MSCWPPRMPTCDEQPDPWKKCTKLGWLAALAGVRWMNRMTVWASQCAMASVTRCWSGMAGSISKGTCPPGQRNWLPVTTTPSANPSPRMAALTCSTSSTLPRSMSPSKMARPSTTAYCSAFWPKVKPVMMAVLTSSELCSSGLSVDAAASPDGLDFDADDLLACLRRDGVGMVPPCPVNVRTAYPEWTLCGECAKSEPNHFARAVHFGG